MTPEERQKLIADAADARKRVGLPYVEIRLDDSDAYVASLSRSTLETVERMEAARRGTRTLSAERRDALIRDAVQIRLDCGDPAGARALEIELRDKSDAGLQARVTGELERGRDHLAWIEQRRAAEARAVVVTASDVEQAERDLQAMRMDGRYASPHATRDEEGYRRAVEMRARSLASQRAARERLDAAQLAAPKVVREESPAPDPVTDGIGPWAAHRKGG